MRNEVWDFENQVSRIGFLHGLAIQAQFQIQSVSVAQGVRGYEIGAERAERIEGFGPQPLAVGKLKVAGRDVIKNGIAGNEVDRPLNWNVTCPSSDHDSKFGFVINLLAQRR